MRQVAISYIQSRLVSVYSSSNASLFTHIPSQAHNEVHLWGTLLHLQFPVQDFLHPQLFRATTPLLSGASRPAAYHSTPTQSHPLVDSQAARYFIRFNDISLINLQSKVSSAVLHWCHSCTQVCQWPPYRSNISIFHL